VYASLRAMHLQWDLSNKLAYLDKTNI